ncbi:hypothetical protein CWI39_2817p0010, partial [Hamiltosporidium magnivora]
INNSTFILVLPFTEIRYLYFTYKLPLLGYLQNIKCKEYMCIIKGCNYKCKEHLCDKMYFEHDTVCYEGCKCVCSYMGVNDMSMLGGVSNKEILEGYRDKDMLKGIEYVTTKLQGVNLNTDKQRDVNYSTNKQRDVNLNTDKQRDVNYSTDKQQDVNYSTNKQRGVNYSTDKQQDVNYSTNKQQDVNYSTDKQQDVNYSTNKQRGVNYSTNKQRDVNYCTNKQRGVNYSTNKYHPFNNRDKDNIMLIRNIIPLIDSINNLLNNNTLLLHSVIERLECLINSLKNNTPLFYYTTNRLLIEHFLLPLILIRVIPLIVDNRCYSYLRFFLENTSSSFIHSMCYCIGIENIDVMSECIGVLSCDVDKVLRHVIEHEKVCECLRCVNNKSVLEGVNNKGILESVNDKDIIEGAYNTTNTPNFLDNNTHPLTNTPIEGVIPVETLKEYLDSPFSDSFISYISKHYPLSSILLLTPSYLHTVLIQHLKYFPKNNLEIIKYVINNVSVITNNNNLLINSFYIPFNELEIFKYLLSIGNIELLDIFIRQREIYYRDRGLEGEGVLVGEYV